MEERLERIFDRLMTWPTAVSVADASEDDCPLIYVNESFCSLTGYSADETIGRNCRFLQGAATDTNAVRQIRDSISNETQVMICLLNYRKDGTPFHNLLVLAPIYRENDQHLIVGCQYEFKRATTDSELGEQLDAVQGAFRQIRRPGDMFWQCFSDSVATRSEATRMLVDTYLNVVPHVTPR